MMAQSVEQTEHPIDVERGALAEPERGASAASSQAAQDTRRDGPADARGAQGPAEAPQANRPQAATTKRLAPAPSGILEDGRWQDAGWYDYRQVRAVHAVLVSWPFKATVNVAVVVALFLSDLSVVCQVPTNSLLNVTLTVVLCIFSVELVGLFVTERDYPNSFLFWMDLVGTVSMIFEIEIFLGQDATQAAPEEFDAVSAVTIARTARAARQAARLGRMTYIRRLIHLLPFGPRRDEKDAKHVAQLISDQLNILLSSRLSFLCIFLIIVLPLLRDYEYPEVDDSLSTWAVLLSADVSEVYSSSSKAAKDRLSRQLGNFVEFYVDTAQHYGPYEVCFRENSNADFDCSPDAILGVDWDTPFAAPRRIASVRIFTADHFRASFNLTSPDQHHAIMNITSVVFLIVCMGFFSLITTAAVSSLVIDPLERMLYVVRSHCAKIIHYTRQIQNDQPAETSDDLVRRNSKGSSDSVEDIQELLAAADRSNEFKLLESVIIKLGAVGHLITEKTVPEMRNDMTENEILVLNFMQEGHRAPSAGGQSNAAEAPLSPVESPGKAQPRLLQNLSEEIIRSLESSSFNALEAPEALKPAIAAHCVLFRQGQPQWLVAESRVDKFVATAAGQYLPNPFHNFSHALDVAVCVRQFLVASGAALFLSELSQLWLVIAAIAHDLGHLGVNNQFLIDTAHALALKYNDSAPLESFHCASLFQIIRDPAANVFEDLPKDLYKEVRLGIVAAILGTDMMMHGKMITEIGLLYEVNSETLDLGLSSPDAMSLLQERANSQTVINALLHFTDVANPMKPWDLCFKYAQLCLDEFFAQGDQEKAAGLPVQMLNDRTKVSRPNSQIGFIEFLILPMAEKMVGLFPGLSPCTDNLGENVRKWADMWAQEASPPEDEKAKVAARVQKVADRCLAASRRGAPQ